MNENKGITLIALVVTIIVLLILAGISIATLTGTNGIITRANEARSENIKGTEREQISLAYLAEKSILIEQRNTEPVKAEDLENRLRTDGAKVTRVEQEDGRLKVTFDTGNFYYVDENGNITDGTPPKPPTPPALGEIEEPKTTTSTEFIKTSGVVEIAWLDLNNNVITEPLSPNIGEMEKVAWNDANDEITATSNIDWYDYNTNKWANAKNPADGSYFVWIPRYAYKIIYFNSEANKRAYIADSTSRNGITGYSTIYGIINTKGEVTNGTQTKITDTVKTDGYRDYIPHPGFLGTGYEDLGGGFGDNNKGIRGIWVAKYEMARENSTNGTTWTAATSGNVATTNAGSSSYIRAVSKPGIRSWTGINIANCYENAYHYDRNKESHLMKNAEWGAVVYLAHSKYGRNGKEVERNGNYMTGGGTGAAYKTNTNQSTTGNTYGIYDLCGNMAEYLAAFNKEYNGDSYGSAFYSEKGKMFATNNGTSSKYVTAYSNKTDIVEDDFTVGDVSHTGDAIREVWAGNSMAWFSDKMNFLDYTRPFFVRGGSYFSTLEPKFSGIFQTSCHLTGDRNSFDSYRVVLAK